MDINCQEGLAACTQMKYNTNFASLMIQALIDYWTLKYVHNKKVAIRFRIKSNLPLHKNYH